MQKNTTLLTSVVIAAAAIVVYFLFFVQKNEKNDSTITENTTVSWSNMVHDFGKIKQHTTNTCTFAFTNTGKAPLLINDATGSCGCTVPEFPKDPIAPGEKGIIKVVYRPGKQSNSQEKVVTISANTDPYKTVLKIRAFVLTH